jgi:hypothetical protein
MAENINKQIFRHVYAAQNRGKNIAIEIEGLHKMRRALIKLDDAARDDFKQAGYQAAEIVVNEAKRLVPVRSGKLGKTIRAHKVVSGAKVSAGRTTVPYAGAIHFGWANVATFARTRFLYDAADKRVNEVMDAYIDSGLRNLEQERVTWQAKKASISINILG